MTFAPPQHGLVQHCPERWRFGSVEDALAVHPPEDKLF
jgi:hypothetical protein